MARNGTCVRRFWGCARQFPLPRAAREPRSHPPPHRGAWPGFLSCRPFAPASSVRHEHAEVIRTLAKRVLKIAEDEKNAASAFASCGHAVAHALVRNGPITDPCSAANTGHLNDPVPLRTQPR